MSKIIATVMFASLLAACSGAEGSGAEASEDASSHADALTKLRVGPKLFYGNEQVSYEALSTRQQAQLNTMLKFVVTKGGELEDDAVCGADETGWSCVTDDTLYWCDNVDGGQSCGSAPIG